MELIKTDQLWSEEERFFKSLSQEKQNQLLMIAAALGIIDVIAEGDKFVFQRKDSNPKDTLK